MKEMFKSKIEIIEFLKKYYKNKRKKELNDNTKLLNELNRKLRLLNEKLKQAKFNKNKINKKIEKIQDAKSGKISIININSYIIRILFITLFYISFSITITSFLDFSNFKNFLSISLKFCEF